MDHDFGCSLVHKFRDILVQISSLSITKDENPAGDPHINFILGCQRLAKLTPMPNKSKDTSI